MATSFRLPDLGEGVHEAEILALPVAIGQAVKEGDIILEVETDKAAVEIPSPYSGTVSDILVSVGDMALVGDVLINFTLEGEGRPSITPVDYAEPAEPTKTGRPTQSETLVPSATSSDRRIIVPASPSTRRLARELEVDLHEVHPTGSGGKVTKEDVENHALLQKEQKQQNHPRASKQQDTVATKDVSPTGETHAQALPEKFTQLPDFSQWGKIERLPFRSIRRATAKQMSSSWNQIPHVHCQDTVDITKLEAFRQKHKADIEAAGGRLTMTLFAMKAVATALKNFPYFNASLDLLSQEIIVKHFFHIGIAVDSGNGLLVPVIKDVDRKSIKELAVEVNGAIQRVREGSFSRDELQGGTFTITNAGALGGSSFTAIINHPEVAILGLGQGRRQPAIIVDDRGREEIAARLIMPIVLCFDHRVVDGADAIRFLRLIIDALEDPEELLITMT